MKLFLQRICYFDISLAVIVFLAPPGIQYCIPPGDTDPPSCLSKVLMLLETLLLDGLVYYMAL